MLFVDLGTIDFKQALEKQEETVCGIVEGCRPETIYLLEHPHVFTLGRAGKGGNLLVERDWQGRLIELIRINRGGDVTYHGPGQLVGYPHLDLRMRGRDVHRYLRELEECLIRTLGHFGIRAFRRTRLTGVWTRAGKVASIGVGVRKMDHDARLRAKSGHRLTLFSADSPLRNGGLSCHLPPGDPGGTDRCKRCQSGFSKELSRRVCNGQWARQGTRGH